MGNAPKNWVETAHSNLVSAFTTKIDELNSKFWQSESDKLKAGAMKSYRDNVVGNWYKRGLNEIFTNDTWEKWKSAYKLHMEALDDWGVSASPMADAFYQTVIEIPETAPKDVAKIGHVVGRTVSETAKETVKGVFSTSGGFVILGIIIIVGVIYASKIGLIGRTSS